MIQLLNTQVQYPNNNLVLPDIELNKGDIIGLSGVSGSGKSTIAMILASFIAPSSGIINLPKFAKNTANPVQWIGQNPEYSFNPKWTLLRSLKESYNNTSFDENLDRFAIDKKWLSRYPQELSGGQLQRLALCRALIPTTQYLLCDEITAQLDPITQKNIWQQLIKLSVSKNIGLLVISHDHSLLHSICHKIVTMY